jgi:hypothetical protein
VLVSVSMLSFCSFHFPPIRGDKAKETCIEGGKGRGTRGNRRRKREGCADCSGVMVRIIEPRENDGWMFWKRGILMMEFAILGPQDWKKHVFGRYFKFHD